MTFPSSIKVSMPNFSWLRNQIQSSRRDEENLVEEEEEEETDDVTSAPQLPTTKTKTNSIPHNFNRNFFIELILLILAFLMFAGMIVTTFLLFTHDGRPQIAEDDLPMAFELKHSQISNLTICLSVYKTSDLSGACLVHTGKDFYGASKMCRDNGMELLEISDEDMKFKVFDETKKLFGSGGGTRIWINGKWSQDESSWLLHPQNESFYLTTEQIQHRSYGRIEQDGNCMAIESNMPDTYHIAACSCGGTHYFYCGY